MTDDLEYRLDECESRDSRPEHFFRAVEHAFSLVLFGAPISLLGTMSRVASKRGLTDAAAGYDHARLRLVVALSSLDSDEDEEEVHG